MLLSKVVDIGHRLYPKKPSYFDYLMKIKETVNPDNKELTGIYGGAGADIRSAFLATNAARFVFINDLGYEFSAERLLSWLTQSNSFSEYMQNVSRHGFCIWQLIETPEAMSLAIAEELRVLGVSLSAVTVADIDGGVRVDFVWQHPTVTTPRSYTVLFMAGDITRPESYTAPFQRELRQGFDIYFQKAGMNIPAAYPRFLPYLETKMNSCGIFITDDIGRDVSDPMPDGYRNEPYYREFPFPLHPLVSEVVLPGISKEKFYKAPAWLAIPSDDDLYGKWLNVRRKIF